MSAIRTRLPGLASRWGRRGEAARRAVRRVLQSIEVTAAVSREVRALPSGPAASNVWRRARHMHLAAARMCAIHGIRVVCRGRFPTGPAILVSNHLSYIDPVAILAHVPAGVVAKSEVGNWPLLGEVIRTMGVLMVDRGCTMSGAIVLRRALRILRAGGSVLAFPEGTTTLGDEVLPFRRGFFGLARIAGCPMVPVAVRYESTEPCWVGDAPFLPHYLRMSARPHTRGQVLVGEALDPRSADSADALAEEARLAVRDMLRSPW